jgi:elongation factor P
MHVTPGKGQASVQTKMKSIKTGVNAEYRFRSDETAIKASLETKDMEFLYQDGDNYFFMDIETFDQIPINIEMLGDDQYYLLPNTKVAINFYQNEPIGVDLPGTVILKVTETEPTLKTATVTSSYKPAVLETGLKTQVPPFISEGESIKVDTSDGRYLERAK